MIMGVIARIRVKMVMKEAVYIDQRIKMVTDMIAGIRTIKAYAWEEAYAEKVDQARRKQLRVGCRSSAFYLGSVAFFMGSTSCVLLLIYVSALFDQEGAKADKSMTFFLLGMAFNVQSRSFQFFSQGIEMNIRMK